MSLDIPGLVLLIQTTKVTYGLSGINIGGSYIGKMEKKNGHCRDYRGYIWIMEKKMETTEITGVI